jgi:MOSC domain-containing protein YiiM
MLLCEDGGMGRLVSVNVGQPQQISVRRGRPLVSAIVKAPVDGRVRVAGINVAGDRQADRRVHGGPDKAVYAYAVEDTAWWAQQLETTLGAGVFGENLTLEGVEVSGAVVGERWRIGDVELEVCQPRLPCAKLGVRFGDLRMVRAFALAGRPGAYLRILREGELGAGDAVELLDRPDHGVTVSLVSRALLIDPSLRPEASRAPQLPARVLQELGEAVA